MDDAAAHPPRENASGLPPEATAGMPRKEPAGLPLECPASRATGVNWTADGALLEWETGSTSPLGLGAELALVAGEDRHCVGIWRAGRRVSCPDSAALPSAIRGGLCAACQAMDKSSSVAADTRIDDPREFAVYLAHHGIAVKVGITAAERGRNRLLEQGALSSALIATGTLASARRMENLLMNALGLVDRMSSARKRLARSSPGEPGERAGQLLELATRARDLPWPPGQRPLEPEVVDHTALYGLREAGLRPAAVVEQLTPGSRLAGTITCRIGRDLYLTTERGLILLDTHLLAGWPLGRSATPALDVPLKPADPPEPEPQDTLF